MRRFATETKPRLLHGHSSQRGLRRLGAAHARRSRAVDQ
jgi:hypothetical protein